MNDKTSSRRSFFSKAGVALTVPAVFAASDPARAETDVAARLAELEDRNALRGLSRQLIGQINADRARRRPEIDASVAAIAGKDFDTQASIDFLQNRSRAIVRIPCTATYKVPVDAPDSVLVDMARLQGEGVLRQTHNRVLELNCTRTMSGWMISRAQLQDVI